MVAIFLNTAAFVLVAISILAVFRNHMYLRQQKKECQKYPFFRIRSEACKAYVDANDRQDSKVDDYEKLYHFANETTKDIDVFGFSFFSWTIGRFCDDILEAQVGSESIEKRLERLAPKGELAQLTKDSMDLLFDATRRNSFLVRLATTRIGYNVLFRMHLLAAALRFMKRHPEHFDRQRKNLEAVEAGVKIRDSLRAFAV